MSFSNLISKKYLSFLIVIMICARGLAEVSSAGESVYLYQVESKKMQFEITALLESGNFKPSTSLETSKVENYGVGYAGEYGLTSLISIRLEGAYFSGREKNSSITTKSDGLKDFGVFGKLNLKNQFNVFIQSGLEISPEELVVNQVDNSISPVSGGVKLVVRGGILLKPKENLNYGFTAAGKYFLQRNMNFKSNLGNESLKINDGHQLSLSGFVEFGTQLRFGSELAWFLQQGATVSSALVPGFTDFEMNRQYLQVNGYLKFPMSNYFSMVAKLGYNTNLNKKRGSVSYDQDDLAFGNVSIWAQF